MSLYLTLLTLLFVRYTAAASENQTLQCRQAFNPYDSLSKSTFTPRRVLDSDDYPDGAYRLNCDSGFAYEGCNTLSMRPACDMFCAERCWSFCNGVFDSRVNMARCMRDNRVEGCAYQLYQIQRLTELKSCKMAYRETLLDHSIQSYRTLGNSTAYIVDLTNKFKTISNTKRIARAVLHLPIKGKLRSPIENLRATVNVIRSVDLGVRFDSFSNEAETLACPPSLVYPALFPISASDNAHESYGLLFGTPYAVRPIYDTLSTSTASTYIESTSMSASTESMATSASLNSELSLSSSSASSLPSQSSSSLSSLPTVPTEDSDGTPLSTDSSQYTDSSYDATTSGSTTDISTSVGPHERGAEEIDEPGIAGYEYVMDVTEFLRSSALQQLGGMPKQLFIYWPGEQPDLLSAAVLELQRGLPETRRFTERGMITIG